MWLVVLSLGNLLPAGGWRMAATRIGPLHRPPQPAVELAEELRRLREQGLTPILVDGPSYQDLAVVHLAGPNPHPGPDGAEFDEWALRPVTVWSTPGPQAEFPYAGVVLHRQGPLRQALGAEALPPAFSWRGIDFQQLSAHGPFRLYRRVSP